MMKQKEKNTKLCVCPSKWGEETVKEEELRNRASTEECKEEKKEERKGKARQD